MMDTGNYIAICRYPVWLRNTPDIGYVSEITKKTKIFSSTETIADVMKWAYKSIEPNNDFIEIQILKDE